LPVPQRLDSGRSGRITGKRPRPTRPFTGDGLLPRRRLFERQREQPVARRQASRGAGRCRCGHGRAPAQRLRLSLSRPARSALPRQRQCRAARPDSGPAMGARQYRRLWRRPGQGDGVRPIGRRRQDRDSDGHAGGAGPLPSRGDDERSAGDGVGAAARNRAGARVHGRRWRSDRRRSARHAGHTLGPGARRDRPLSRRRHLHGAGARHEMAAPPSLLAGRQSAGQRDPDDARQHA